MKKFILFIFTFFALINLYCEKYNIEKVIELINNGNYDEAIKILQSNGQKNDILLALAYLGKTDFANAKVFAKRGWSSNDILSNYILALVYEEEKDYEKALIYWENLLKNVSDNNLRKLAKKHINVIKKIR